MRLGMYAIYDKCTGYMIPSFQQNDEQAIRAFSYDLKTEDMSILKLNPEDFQLEKVGIFDTNTGEVEPIDIEVLATAREIIKGE